MTRDHIRELAFARKLAVLTERTDERAFVQTTDARVYCGHVDDGDGSTLGLNDTEVFFPRTKKWVKLPESDSIYFDRSQIRRVWYERDGHSFTFQREGDDAGWCSFVDAIGGCELKPRLSVSRAR